MDDVKLDQYRSNAYKSEKLQPKSGFLHTVYRPKASSDPMGDENRMFQVCVSFLPNLRLITEEEIKPPYRSVKVDWECLNVGDYLSGPNGIVFVADISPPNQTLVVETNDIVTLINKNKAIFFRFPANITCDEIQDLSDDIPVKYTALVPNFKGSEPRPLDILRNDNEVRYVIDKAELYNNVWKLSLLLLV